MRYSLVASLFAILVFASCVQLTVDGTPVHGQVHSVSAADIHAAVAAVRAENPPARTARIREIRVIDADNIYLVSSPRRHEVEGRFEAKRIRGRWHYSGSYIGP